MSLFLHFSGLNFVLYLTTSERLRAAYWIFLKDVVRRGGGPDVSITQTWWSGLRKLSLPEEIQTSPVSEKDGTEICSNSVHIDIASGTVSFR